MRQAYAGACLVDEQCYGGGARGMVRHLYPPQYSHANNSDLVLAPRLRPRQPLSRHVPGRVREIRQLSRATRRPGHHPNGRKRLSPPERDPRPRLLPRLRRHDRGYPQHLAQRRCSDHGMHTPPIFHIHTVLTNSVSMVDLAQRRPKLQPQHRLRARSQGCARALQGPRLRVLLRYNWYPAAQRYQPEEPPYRCRTHQAG